MKRKVILAICDGLGHRAEHEHNAVAAARTPNLDRFRARGAFALLQASGEAIGLPAGQMGTSEANHLVIGSGRVIYQNLAKINQAASSGALRHNTAIIDACEHVKRYGGALHIKGIASTGGVHGHTDHLKELVRSAKAQGLERVFIHLFTDGRDVPPKSAIEHVADLEDFLVSEGVGRIASIGGRYWGMDRDGNDERIEKHFLVMTGGSPRRFKSALDAIEHAYGQDITDEFIEPASIELGEAGDGLIGANDAVIFANFRSDRAKQLARRMSTAGISNLNYVSMTKYDDDLDVRVAFPPESITNTLSETIARNNLRQLKVTETEKFTHLTFFFNAQKYEPEPLEERVMVSSNKDVLTHDEKPEMQAEAIADEVCRAVAAENFDFIAANLTNCDMVGHSGNFPAIVRAVETVDEALGRIADEAAKHGYDMIVTADHGNAEQTFDSGQPMTSHTVNPVPFYLLSNRFQALTRPDGDLSDIAPTILKILDLPIPVGMTGKPLI